jgi:hypothetical protein
MGGGPLTSTTESGKREIIVVGAGIGGLSSAYYASRRGHDVTVLEASDCVGGRMVSWCVDGDRVDAGAQFFHSNFKNIRKLIEELGLGDRVTPITLTVQIAREDGPPVVTKSVAGVIRSLGIRGVFSLGWFFVRYVVFGRRFSLFTVVRMPDPGLAPDRRLTRHLALGSSQRSISSEIAVTA